jgi:enoyl-CoA hydratase/carnithine racemase
MSELLRVENRANGVTWITITRPDARNALSRDLNIELRDIAYQLNTDDDVRAVVITAIGDKAFSAGADLKERKGVAAEDSAVFINAISSAIAQVGELRCVTIAAMNGSAYGGGLELALACDFRLLVEGAEVGLTEVRLGIMPGAGGSIRLPRLIGEARAKELILLGRRISAQRAYEIGLVNQVAARGQLATDVDALLTELQGCAPISLRAAKQSIQRASESDLETALRVERECYDQTLFSQDRDEGLAAFAEGRPPRYQGR